MPELPEVQTIVDDVSPLVRNKKIDHVEIKDDGIIHTPGKDEFEELMYGTRINHVRRRGKYIIFELDNGYYLVVHLRLTGKLLYLEEEKKKSRYEYIFFEFQDGSELRLGSQRKFTRVYLVPELDQAGSLVELGPEPLDDEFDLSQFKDIMEKRRGMIKPLLLNQRFIAGIGNIYADEALFLAGIHPERKADTLTEEDIGNLYRSIKKVLKEGIEHSGTTIQNYVNTSGEEGGHQNYLRVYGRGGKPCVRCSTEIKKTEVCGRGTHYCPECQKECQRTLSLSK